MAYAQPISIPVIQTDEDTRAQFIARVYQHIGMAILAFVAMEYVLFAVGLAEAMANFFASTGWAWLVLLGGVSLAGSIASNCAHNLGNTTLQYAGLFGEAAVNAVIFAPLLYFIFRDSQGTSTVMWSAVITLLGFGVLSVVAYTSKKDFSFLRSGIKWASILAFVLIGAAVIFGFQLGIFFSIAMVGLSGMMILYKTQQISRQYPADAYVGAAVALFGSLMLMFWYVLRIVSSLRS